MAGKSRKDRENTSNRYGATDLLNWGLDVATDPRHSAWICILLLAADAALCGVIILKVPYTEIDWTAYMEQVESFLAGERDYVKIRGGTGPLVYPAAHVYIYTALYYLTDRGRNIRRAQWIFAGLYLATEALVMSCYRLAKVPPYIFPLLVLSKRLHSIYMLRMFNDCFATAALFLATYAYQKRAWVAGSLAYSLGVGIKMNVLLSLPAVALILLQGLFLGKVWERALQHGLLMGSLQVLLATPFLVRNPVSYVSKAFEFSRVFLFKWTVNWRFISEEAFLSKEFSTSLLLAHASILLLFIFTRWLNPLASNRISLWSALFKNIQAQRRGAVNRMVNPDFVLTTITASAVIGMLCARSLHYQFYSWLAWASPFLLFKAPYPPVVKILLWAAQERAWNIYPSTDFSSAIVVFVLFITVLGVYLGTTEQSSTSSSNAQKTRRVKS